MLVVEGVKCKDELVYMFAETMKESSEFPEISRETTVAQCQCVVTKP